MPARTTKINKPVRVRTLKLEEKQRYYEARIDGLNNRAASNLVNVTEKTGSGWAKEWVEAGNDPFDSQTPVGPKTKREAAPDARKALDNFPYFQERYLGRVSLPWQQDAADTVVRLAASPEKEYLVINCPPGAGKSTLITHDILVWLIARDRGIRICILSSTQKNAEKFADRIRRTLEATVPIKAPEKELRLGISKDATTTLAKDFGRFKPEEATTWTKQKFYVDRPADQESHKDATIEAYGRDQAFLGGRYDVVVCDDVYDPKHTKTFESKQEIKEWFADTAESRLEPSGLMILNMQRVDPEDLSRFALDMEAFDFGEDEEVDAEELAEIAAEQKRLGIDPLPIRDGITRKYRHIVYKSHFDEQCKGSAFHKLDSPAYPEGCLLYPRRLSYRFLKTKEKNDPGKYRVWYQQEDFEPGNVLAEPVWIKGGLDEFGIMHPGCWDTDRGVRELPPVSTNFHSFLTVDPSPSQFWAIEWWIYHEPTKELFLVDLLRQKMSSAKFFDFDPRTEIATGELCRIYDASVNIGAPITHLVPEVNAAQKFMYDQSPLVLWLRSRSISIMPHTTTAQNKNSEEFGVQTLQSWFREGRIRLPGRQSDVLQSRIRSLKLVDEATKYRLDGTSAYTTDCVMACWFAIRAIDKLYRPKKQLPRLPRPSWAGQRPHLGVISA